MKFSDFKMFEKTPYKLPNPTTYVEALITGIKEEEKTFGPAFALRFIKYALWFIAQKTEEKRHKVIGMFF